MISGLFLTWLWGDAPVSFWRTYQELLSAVANYFSLPFLLKTLIDPWRHDQVGLSRLPLSAWSQAILNNIVSRFIGLMVRGSVILAGLVVLFFLAVGGFLALIIWYALPLLLVGSMVYGLMLISRGFYG